MIGLGPADVDDLAAGPRRLEGADDAVDGVADVGERPGLLAVTVDLHRLPVQKGLDEGHHRAAPPAEVVARAVGVEQAQDRDLQPTLFREREGEVLVVQLRGRVCPAPAGRRPEDERVVLGVRWLAVSVHVGGRGDDEIGSHRQRGTEDGVGTGDVDLQGGERAVVARDLLRRQVCDRVTAVERRAQLPAVQAVDRLEMEARVIQTGSRDSSSTHTTDRRCRRPRSPRRATGRRDATR